MQDWLSWVGTVAFALSGYLVGVRRRLDLLGVCILSLLSAVGGGIIRDVCLNRIPRVFVQGGILPTIFATMLLAWALGLHRRERVRLYTVFVIADAIGLVMFSVAGATAGLETGLNAFGVVFLAFVSSVGGGIVRDAMINEVPGILHQDFYGTVSILVGISLWAAHEFSIAPSTAAPVLIPLALAVRLLAWRGGLRLPKVWRDPQAKGSTDAGRQEP